MAEIDFLRRHPTAAKEVESRLPQGLIKLLHSCRPELAIADAFRRVGRLEVHLTERVTEGAGQLRRAIARVPGCPQSISRLLRLSKNQVPDTKRKRTGTYAHLSHLLHRRLDRGHALSDHLFGRRHIVKWEHMNVAQHAFDTLQLLSETLRGCLLAPSVEVLADQRSAEDEHGDCRHPYDRGQRPVPAHILADTIEAACRSRGNRLTVQIVLEILGKRSCAGIAPLWILFETGRDDGLEVCRNPPVALTQGSRFVGDDLHQGFDPRRAGKRRLARDQVIQRGTYPIYVDPTVDQSGISLDLLRRHIGRGSDDHSSERHTGRSDLARDPEIENIGVQAFAVPALDHDVSWLDVAVDHPHRVSGLDRFCDLLHHHDPLIQGEI